MSLNAGTAADNMVVMDMADKYTDLSSKQIAIQRGDAVSVMYTVSNT